MEPSFLEQASLWGQVFEIAVKRGVLLYLIHQKLLPEAHPALKPWQESQNTEVYQSVLKALRQTDANAQTWIRTMVRHLLVLGYGLGWTGMRECLKQMRLRQASLEAIWCPLTRPGQQANRDAEQEATAQAFQAAFNLPGQPDVALLQTGKPGRADFLLWLSKPEKTRFLAQNSPKNLSQNVIICLEFSYNAPSQIADFSRETPHREEISRYAQAMEARGVFSRVCAEVAGEEFVLSSKLAEHLFAFSGSDKPLFKLCQASSYTERLIHLLRSHGRLQGGCAARAIAMTSNGFESLAAHFSAQEPEVDPRARLMKSWGEAYRRVRKPEEPDPQQLQTEIRLVFERLLRSLPTHFKQQVEAIESRPDFGGDLHFLFQEAVEGFYSPMQAISRESVMAAVEETEALREYWGENPQSHLAVALNQHDPSSEQFPLRQVHAAAVVAGLTAAQTGKLNVIALEGNPGIGKTTAVMDFLKHQSEGFLFLYVSPRLVINRDVTTKLAQDQGKATGILTLTTHANLIAAAPKWYKEQINQPGWQPRLIDSAVVVDGVAGLNNPDCSTVFLTPEQEHEIDCQIIASMRYKRSRNEREDRVESIQRPGVLRTLAKATRQLLDANSAVNRVVLTAATQGYRWVNQKTTVDALSNLFAKKADTVAGKNERQRFATRIPTIVAMIDEVAGDHAGAPFVHKVAEWLHQQFIEPFEGSQSPFKIILIIADASLSNEGVLNSFLNSGNRAPDKVLISPSQGVAPFRVTGTYTNVGLRKYPMLHVMTNSYPATALNIDYSIRLSPLIRPSTSEGKKQTIRHAIRSQFDDEHLSNACQEIQRGLKQGAEQLIFFAQDKAFLRQLRDKLIEENSGGCNLDEIAVLDQSVPPHERLKLVQEPRRDQIRVFLMTSSGARGVSFPKTDWIIAAIPRFKIEAALMEVAQLIYRGRGMYTHPETGVPISGDDKARRLVMLIHDFVVEDEEIDRQRVWLRQSSDLLTLLVMLRSTLHTRIKGDAGLRRQRIAFVPVGAVGDEALLSLMSEEVWRFLHEAKVFIYDADSEAAKGMVSKAVQLTHQIFAMFTLQGLAPDRHAKSYGDYKTLEAFVKVVSRSSSRLLPLLDNTLVIPENLTCIGPFWMEDWSDRNTEERFSFEGWREDVQKNSSELLGLLRQIVQGTQFPPKLKRPVKELYTLLSREQKEKTLEYSTLQALKSEHLVIGLPLDYPHFWSEQLEEEMTQKKELEDPETWRTALGFSLTPQGLVMPVVPQYRSFPWVAVAGRQILAQLETVFGDRYFMASSELNLLNTILLEED